MKGFALSTDQCLCKTKLFTVSPWKRVKETGICLFKKKAFFSVLSVTRSILCCDVIWSNHWWQLQVQSFCEHIKQSMSHTVLQTRQKIKNVHICQHVLFSVLCSVPLWATKLFKESSCFGSKLNCNKKQIRPKIISHL